ncbi:MAG TPA: hypothetical protein VGU72_09765 [Beijerinckiaceae bacterium]|jgi:hypothetical protein|nr:hypothetical protein [Beijerinckiaceae bacterium]
MEGYPPGYIGSVKAMLRIAKAAYPARWAKEAVTDAEAAAWRSLGVSIRGSEVEKHVYIQVPQPHPHDLMNRIVDYREAREFLLDALASGAITARFVDEFGKFHSFDEAVWRARHAQEIILDGIADELVLRIGDHHWLVFNSRILLSRSDVDQLCAIARQKGLVARDDVFSEIEPPETGTTDDAKGNLPELQIEPSNIDAEVIRSKATAIIESAMAERPEKTIGKEAGVSLLRKQFSKDEIWAAWPGSGSDRIKAMRDFVGGITKSDGLAGRRPIIQAGDKSDIHSR